MRGVGCRGGAGRARTGWWRRTQFPLPRLGLRRPLPPFFPKRREPRFSFASNVALLKSLERKYRTKLAGKACLRRAKGRPEIFRRSVARAPRSAAHRRANLPGASISNGQNITFVTRSSTNPLNLQSGKLSGEDWPEVETERRRHILSPAVKHGDM